jgi:hypothetical protein
LIGIKHQEGQLGATLESDLSAPILWAGDVESETDTADTDGINEDGCSAFAGDAFKDSVALIRRGNCTFDTKVANATAAGAVAMIVFNNAGDDLIDMSGAGTAAIPAVFIGQTNGEAMMDWCTNHEGSTVLIRKPFSFE